METEPLSFDHSSLISEGLENVRLSVFDQYLLFFDQNLPYLLVFLHYFMMCRHQGCHGNLIDT